MHHAESLKSLKKKLVKIRPQLLAANVDLRRSDVIFAMLDQQNEGYLKGYDSDIEALLIKGGAYYEFMQIYGLRPPEWWQNMARLGQTNLREHLLLNAAAKVLRKEWRELHAKGKKYPKQNHASEDPVGISN